MYRYLKVQKAVYTHRHHHSSERPETRQRSLPDTAEASVNERPLDVEPNNEEEERHQTLVNPLLDAHVQTQGSGTEVGFPEVNIIVTEIRVVCESQGSGTSSQKKETAQTSVQKLVNLKPFINTRELKKLLRTSYRRAA